MYEIRYRAGDVAISAWLDSQETRRHSEIALARTATNVILLERPEGVEVAATAQATALGGDAGDDDRVNNARSTRTQLAGEALGVADRLLGHVIFASVGL